MQTMLEIQEEQRFDELCQMAFNFARRDECENLKIMLQAGLNINLKTHKGDTLLMLAAYNNSLACAKMLLQQGALVDEPNDRGQTPLAGVCFKGYIKMAKLLLDYGANPNAKNALGATPYTFAILFGRQQIAELLLKYSYASLPKKSSLAILRFIKGDWVLDCFNKLSFPKATHKV